MRRDAEAATVTGLNNYQFVCVLIMNPLQVRAPPGTTGGHTVSIFPARASLSAVFCGIVGGERGGAKMISLKPPSFCIFHQEGAQRGLNCFNQDGDKKRKAASSAALQDQA